MAWHATHDIIVCGIARSLLCAACGCVLQRH